MFKNYFKIALVNLKKHKAFSLINILGLAIGLACCILITSYVLYEFSYDKFHKNSDEIYRLRVDLKISGDQLDFPKSSPPMGEHLVANFPEVVSSVRFRSLGRLPIKYHDKLFFEEKLFYADNSVFEVFSFPLLKGNPQAALKAAHSIVITEEMAAKYFGREEPIGQVITLNNEAEFTVTGVAENIPFNSHFRFNMLCSFATYAESNKRDMNNWLSLNNYTYIRLNKGFAAAHLEKKFPEMIDKQVGGMLQQVKGEMRLLLQPLEKIHLYSNLKQEISGNSSITYVYMFIAVALLILIIACVNFMNLSTARSSIRAKEIGLRKVLGANRSNIIRQFLIESIVFSFIAFIFALLLAELALPIFRHISGMQLQLLTFRNPLIYAGILASILLCGLLAGSYPAFFLSSFQPKLVLKGLFTTRKARSRFRSGMVIGQFTISIFLIIGTLTVFNQLNFMKNQRLGFNKERMLIIPISDSSTLSSLRPLQEELLGHINILNVATSSHVPGQTTFVNPFLPEGYSMSEMQYMGELYIDHNFIPAMGIKLAAGRNFSPDLTTDIEKSVIINETAAKQFGWQDPIGKTISEITMSQRLRKYTVIGVVEDFHIESLHKKITPLYISYTTHAINSFCIRISPDNIPATISFLEAKIKEFFPARPFEFQFLDDSFDAQYRAEERLSKIFSYFSILAIFIACLGLFGLAAFSAEQKTKEIGIRKVLGASISSLVALLSREFLKWVLIANAIAWPMAYYFLNQWLQNFAYRTEISFLAFIFAGAISFAIAFITVYTQTFKASTADPVHSLRYE